MIIRSIVYIYATFAGKIFKVVEIRIRNIVLVGVFSPLVFDKYFFITSSIYSDKEFSDSTKYSFQTEQVQVNGSEFQVVIHPTQAIITLGDTTDYSRIQSAISKIVDSSGTIKIIAAGFNFIYFLQDIPEEIAAMTRTKFANRESLIIDKYFSSSDSKFGIFASTDFKGTRLKLDIKPVSLTKSTFGQELELPKEAIHFQFNFHLDILEGQPASKLISCLLNYSEYESLSQEIISNI